MSPESSNDPKRDIEKLLAGYLTEEGEEPATLPSIDELNRRIQMRGSVGGTSGADLVRADRDERS